MDAPKSPRYAPFRLHRHSEDSWAVVCGETGAIALDDQNRLIMRLSREEATRVAEEMNRSGARDANSPRDA